MVCPCWWQKRAEERRAIWEELAGGVKKPEKLSLKVD